jgi:hypothetical protein
VEWSNIHFISENFLSTLDTFKITSSDSKDINYIDEEAVTDYWLKIIEVSDE